MKPRIMYIERGGGLAAGVHGDARIGLVSFSKTGVTLYYDDKTFRPLRGYKANYRELQSREEYWISGPRRDGEDGLYPIVVEIDDEVRVEYWTEIRGEPERKDQSSFRCSGKHSRRSR